MSKKYKIQRIGNNDYELHPVKADSRAIGFVPVRVIGDIDDLVKQIADNETTEAQAVADYKYGLAVRLQREARSLLTGDTFNEAAYNRELDELGDGVLEYVGKAAVLREELKRRWLQRQNKARGEHDSTQVFTDLIGK